MTPTTKPSPLLDALAAAKASNDATRAALIAMPNGTSIRMRVEEQRARRAALDPADDLVHSAAHVREAEARAAKALETTIRIKNRVKPVLTSSGTVDVAALDAAVNEILVASHLILDLPAADKRRADLVRGALEGLAGAVQVALNEVRR